MTQIVGIVYRQGILIASESQYTSPDRQKTFDAEKIGVLRLNNGDVILAECGSVSMSNRAAGYIKEATNNTEITSEDCIAKIIEDVVNKIRGEILKGYPERTYTVMELDEIYEKYNFGLMFGYYFKPPRSEESPHSKAIPCLYMFEKIQELGFQATRWLLTAFLIFVS